MCLSANHVCSNHENVVDDMELRGNERFVSNFSSSSYREVYIKYSLALSRQTLVL